MSQNDKAASRRDFLKLASVSAPAAAAAIAVPGAKAEAQAAAVDDGKMQDTAHTRAFYETARF
ncbi:formate dehydrogenase region TAT target [Tranquillimonas rosea]|uniref:Formate dehydrogenase region TAT target n=1 Tax=Tranquillimonas rosea TaxID=641238 RepID=A0A1H9WBP6_9RHOB|nr:ubiquinol-cytochrome c reductase iron-sulfur subunit N-terminal domain-containing protein [Tranquillimonas rosea]SES31087.1 formate dehydrogenase region TAT target [Tranquillimonas rosea]